MEKSKEFFQYVQTILHGIQNSGAAMSHHHGIGKMFAPFLEDTLGKNEYGIFRALKNYFDKDFILNPGGTIGLDLKDSEKVKKDK